MCVVGTVQPSTQSRRTVLALAGTAAVGSLAGCLDALGGDGGGDGDGRALKLSMEHEEGSLRDRFVRSLDDSGSSGDEAAFAAARNGTAYTTTFHTPFLARGEPAYAEHDGTYYELGSVVVDESTATHPVLRLKTVGRTDQLDSVPEHVDASSLPAVDERAVHVAHMAARARGNAGGYPRELVDRGGYVYRDEDAVADSSLLDGSPPSHVAFRDTIYAVDVARERFHEPVYRAVVEPVADDPAQMEEILRARLVTASVEREQLSEAARSIMREAAAEGYAESHPYSDGYREVLKALHRRAYLDGNVEKDAGDDDPSFRYIEYGGEYYEYLLRFTT